VEVCNQAEYFDDIKSEKVPRICWTWRSQARRSPSGKFEDDYEEALKQIKREKAKAKKSSEPRIGHVLSRAS
jgi:hypothetical protein